MNIRTNLYKFLLKCLSGHGLYKYSIFIKLHKSVMLLFSSNTTNIRGFKYYLGEGNYKRFSITDMDKAHDPLEIKQMELNIKDGDNVIDVGANIGLMTLLLSKFVGKHGTVFAFEPHPENLEIFHKNIKINNIENIILENKAVSNHDGKAKLFDGWIKNEQSTAKLFRVEGQPSSFIETSIVSLDTYFDKIKLIDKISFVKIDVEGVEFDVIKGMQGILEKNPKIQLIIEFIPRQIIASGANPKEMLDFLIFRGFKIYWFDYGVDKKMKLVDNIDELIKEDHFQSVNILCKRN